VRSSNNQSCEPRHSETNSKAEKKTFNFSLSQYLDNFSEKPSGMRQAMSCDTEGLSQASLMPQGRLAI